MNLSAKTRTQAVPVGDFLVAARAAVEAGIPPQWISGEVANFFRAASGHWYFVLRDSAAQADCVMLKNANALVSPPLADGEAVEVLAQASIYPPRGRFQLMARMVRRAGAGRLYQLYAERKRDWAAKGWFDSAAKKTPPFWPDSVGVVASPQGAAARDVLRTLKTRMPSVNVVLYPAPAQGADAAPKIAAAVDEANRRRECQVLIVCRGGGGIEDLWAYNEEETVAAIVRSRLPVIVGVGHEIDETLADFAADVRAPTPTAAAVAAAPDRRELLARLSSAAGRIGRAARRALADRAQQLDIAAAAARRPQWLLQQKQAQLARAAAAMIRGGQWSVAEKRRRLRDAAVLCRRPPLSPPTSALESVAVRLHSAAAARMQAAEFRLQGSAAVFRACAPAQTLARGYSIVRRDGAIVRRGDSLSSGDRLRIVFSRGEAEAAVESAADTADSNPLNS